MQSLSRVFMVTMIGPLQGVTDGVVTGFPVLTCSSDTGCKGDLSITTGITFF